MKKVFKTMVACTAMMLLVACGNQTGYKLVVNIEGGSDDMVFALTPAGTHDTEEAIASLPLKDGKVVFTGEVEGPRFFSISIEGVQSRHILLFLDKGYNVTVSATVEKTENQDAIQYRFADIDIKGSPLTDEYKEKRAFRDDLDKMYTGYHERNKEVSSEMGKARAAKDQKKMDEIMLTDAYKQLAKEEKEFFQAVETQIKGAILNEKDSWWGPFMMLTNYTYFTPDAHEVFDQLSDQAKESHYGQIVKNKVYPESLIGKKVPGFSVVGQDGKEYSLQQLLEGKKYVLIDFWASWCAPCRKEIPNLKKEYAQYHDKGFEIISISTDKVEADWFKALDQEKLVWHNFRDTDGSISKLYKVQAIPAMFLVDANGVLIAENLRGEELANKLSELLD